MVKIKSLHVVKVLDAGGEIVKVLGAGGKIVKGFESKIGRAHV